MNLPLLFEIPGRCKLITAHISIVLLVSIVNQLVGFEVASVGERLLTDVAGTHGCCGTVVAVVASPGVPYAARIVE